MFIALPGLPYLIGWVIIGVLAGFLASKVMRGKDYGCVGNTIVGLIGAVVGGFLANLLGVGGRFSFVGSVVVAFIGACVFLWLLRILTGDKRKF